MAIQETDFLGHSVYPFLLFFDIRFNLLWGCLTAGFTEINTYNFAFIFRFLFLLCDVVVDCFCVMGVWTVCN